MPLLRRRPIQNLKSQVYHAQLHAQVGNGATTGIQVLFGRTRKGCWCDCLDRLDRLSTKDTLPVDASSAQAQDDTPNMGTLHLHSVSSPDDSEQHSTPARRLEGLEITTPHLGTIKLSSILSDPSPQQRQRRGMVGGRCTNRGPPVEGRARASPPPGSFTKSDSRRQDDT